MIDDAELRSLFKAESQEHLQKLDEGLLYLEAQPGDVSTIDDVFRAAHSLKGNARMLGESAVETTAHAFEEALGEVRRGVVKLTPEMVERLYRGIDALRRLVEESVTGIASGVQVERCIAQLKGEIPFDEAADAPQEVSSEALDDLTPDDEPGIAAAPESVGVISPVEIAVRSSTDDESSLPAVAVEEPTRATPTGFRVESVRIDPTKLDALLSLAGELTVSTGRLTRGASDFEALLSLWEEWVKDISEQRLRRRPLQADPDTLRLDDARRERDQQRLERMAELLENMRRSTREEIVRLDAIASDLESAIRETRLLPLSTIFSLFPRPVRDLARTQGKEIDFVIEGSETSVDRRILEEIKDPLLHMIRNAIDHGLEVPNERISKGKAPTGRLRLSACRTPNGVAVELEDDGRGLDLEAIRRTALKRRLCRPEELAALTPEQTQMLIFAPGFSTSAAITDVSGRGVGLDVVRANVESLKGSIVIESEPGQGCRFRLLLPTTLSTTSVLLVECRGRTYALPVESVEGTCLLQRERIFQFEGRETIRFGDRPVSVASLADLLGVPAASGRSYDNARDADAPLACIVLTVNGEPFGLLVDTLLSEQQVIFKSLGEPLRRVPNVAGATILGTGEICIILNPFDLLKTVRRGGHAPVVPLSVEAPPPKTILLVDDSITVRTQEKRIVESAGYAVVTAVDGRDALQQMAHHQFDAVVSDIEMPNMDGLTLAARIREDPQHKETPIILVTSLATDEDRRRGLEVGADAYITKGSFDQNTLIDALRRLA